MTYSRSPAPTAFLALLHYPHDYRRPPHRHLQHKHGCSHVRHEIGRRETSGGIEGEVRWIQKRASGIGISEEKAGVVEEVCLHLAAKPADIGR